MSPSVAVPMLLLVSSLPSVIVPLACRRAPTPVLNAAAAPVDDWGGLPGAIKSSKCGAINYQVPCPAPPQAPARASPAHSFEQIINAQSTDVVLGLVVDNFQTLNGVIQHVSIPSQNPQRWPRLVPVPQPLAGLRAARVLLQSAECSPRASSASPRRQWCPR